MGLEEEKELFKEGIKDVLMVGNDESLVGLGTYIRLSLPEYGYTLVFKDVDKYNYAMGLMLKEKYRLKSNSVYESTSKVLGDILGYPPLATEAWGKYFMFDSANERTKAKVNYYGIEFYCLPEDVEDCVSWMEEKYKLPEELKENKEIIIEYIN